MCRSIRYGKQILDDKPCRVNPSNYLMTLIARWYSASRVETMDQMKIKARIEELLSLQPQSMANTSAWAAELYQGALGMLELTHGENSNQAAALREAVASYQKNKDNPLLIIAR